LSILSILVAFAHSGRTDGAGGHRDNNNMSRLGYYHYHCGGYPAHLHSGGVCPYKSDSFSSTDSSSNVSFISDSIDETYATEYDYGYDDGYSEGYDDGLVDGRKEGEEKGHDDAIDAQEEYYSEGFDDGENSGYKEGFTKGRESGFVDGIFITVIVIGIAGISIFLFSSKDKDVKK
jgi:hypothetical protein